MLSDKRRKSLHDDGLFLSWRVWSDFCLLSELLGVLKMSRLSADLGLKMGQLVRGKLLRLFIGSL